MSLANNDQPLNAGIAISWATGFEAIARDFARENNLPIINELLNWRGLCFNIDASGWSIIDTINTKSIPFALQFKAKHLAKGKDPLLKAMGEVSTVLDMTAGWGGDALHIAQTGRDVVAIERNPIVFQFLKQASDEIGVESAKSLQFLNLDSAHDDFARALEFALKAKPHFDLVYLDPMFQGEKNKQARSRKPMQIMQSLVSPPTVQNELQLFENAMKIANKRVVVKRAINADFIAGQVPQGSIKSKLLRFDLYKPFERNHPDNAQC